MLITKEPLLLNTIMYGIVIEHRKAGRRLADTYIFEWCTCSIAIALVCVIRSKKCPFFKHTRIFRENIIYVSLHFPFSNPIATLAFNAASQGQTFPTAAHHCAHAGECRPVFRIKVASSLGACQRGFLVNS